MHADTFNSSRAKTKYCQLVDTMLTVCIKKDDIYKRYKNLYHSKGGFAGVGRLYKK